VDYMAARYLKAAEIGIGHAPEVALALRERGVEVFATDTRPFAYKGLTVIEDDVTNPRSAEYEGVNLIYSLRPPPELIPYMVRLARYLSSDLIIKPLSSEWAGGRLLRHGHTTFFLWNYR
jgi:uncharacterized UPF0146 family protein